MSNDSFEYININLDDKTKIQGHTNNSKNNAIEDNETENNDIENNDIEYNDTADNVSKKGSKKALISDIVSYLLIIAAAFAISLFINNFLILNARVPTGSMIPTIEIKDRIIGNRLAYNKKSPARGDVIIFYFPDDETQKYVKRVIGLPGETVEIIDGKVFIDGELLDESAYLTVTPYGNDGPYTVPEGCYFVMGDNRNHSWDSRRWTNTYVSEDKIIAKAIFRYFPGFKKIQ